MHILTVWIVFHINMSVGLSYKNLIKKIVNFKLSYMELNIYIISHQYGWSRRRENNDVKEVKGSMTKVGPALHGLNQAKTIRPLWIPLSH